MLFTVYGSVFVLCVLCVYIDAAVVVVLSMQFVHIDKFKWWMLLPQTTHIFVFCFVWLCYPPRLFAIVAVQCHVQKLFREFEAIRVMFHPVFLSHLEQCYSV